MDAISNLQKLLSLSDKTEAKSYSEYFKEIAELIMNKCVIAKGETKYEIVEIEFYLYTDDHQDVITYPRRLSAGRWFFHQSGVDLTFESKENQFGGILIRGIKRITPCEDGKDKSQLILGPQKCVDELWNFFNAFNVEQVEYPVLKEDISICRDESIKESRRWINVTEDKNTKIAQWSRRISDAGVKPPSIKSEQGVILVFDSKYRFLKLASIDKASEAWRKYSAKPKLD